MQIPNLHSRPTESASQANVYQALKFIFIRQFSEIVLERDVDINQVFTLTCNLQSKCYGEQYTMIIHGLFTQ